jgi:N-methylhydantoinase B/oxoprolinase/acetone carboxylase alpha subunit
VTGAADLPDLHVIQPIFHDGELEGYAATMAHHVDVGGLTPGSIAVHATEIFQAFHHVSAGGGGSGSPFERDPALVLEDVLDEKVGVEAARERYGVVIVDGRVDEQPTAEARS